MVTCSDYDDVMLHRVCNGYAAYDNGDLHNGINFMVENSNYYGK